MLYWLLRDLTERKRVEETLGAPSPSLCSANWPLEYPMKSAIPLGAIMLPMDPLGRRTSRSPTGASSAVAAHLAEVRTQLTRLDDLVQDYLSLARIASLQREPTDMGAFVDTFLQEGAPQVAQGVGYTAARRTCLSGTGGAPHQHVSPGPPQPCAECARCNAAGRNPDAPKLAGGLHVHLDISDTGTGIPADQLTQIFEPLHTTKQTGTGFDSTWCGKLSPRTMVRSG